MDLTPDTEDSHENRVRSVVILDTCIYTPDYNGVSRSARARALRKP